MEPPFSRVMGMSDARYYVGLDVGGTTMKAGVVDDDGLPVSAVSLPTEAARGQEFGLERMCETIRQAVTSAGLSLDAIAASAHELVAVPLDGSAATDRSRIPVLWRGSDFVSSPRLSYDGESLAFVTWEHPSMPWDETALRVGRLDGLGQFGDRDSVAVMPTAVVVG